MEHLVTVGVVLEDEAVQKSVERRSKIERIYRTGTFV